MDKSTGGGYICSRIFVLPGKIMGFTDILAYVYHRYTFPRISISPPLGTLIRRYTYDLCGRNSGQNPLKTVSMFTGKKDK